MTVYVVCDIESDGPIPGPNSMISFGAVAVDRSGEYFGEFEINLHPLKYANSDPVTVKWFNESAPEAFEYTKQNRVSPDVAMNKFGDWLLNLPGPRVMAAHPASIDFMWLNWYMQNFLQHRLEKPPFTIPFFNSRGQSAFCIKSYATAVLKKDFVAVDRETYPKELHDNKRHTHRAIDDAREYANLLVKLLNKDL